MNSYQEQCVEAKAVRAGIIEQRPLRPKNKKDRKPKVWQVVGPILSKKAYVWHRAATSEECVAWLEREARRREFARADWSQDKINAHRQSVAVRLAQYKIIGPA